MTLFQILVLSVWISTGSVHVAGNDVVIRPYVGYPDGQVTVALDQRNLE